MDTEVAQRIINYLLVMKMDIEVNTDRGDFTTNTKICKTGSEFPDIIQFWNLEPKVLKIFAFSNELGLVKEIRKELSFLQEISVTSSAAWNIEITAETVKKGTMLKKAMKFYQVSKEEVIIFGDGENDETMFLEFCHSRAMENAVPIIRKLAEKVIESNQKNGMAKEINRILGGT